MSRRVTNQPGTPAGEEKANPGANGKDGAGVNGKCQHYWVIESPDGPTSIGVCKHCGVVREFDNFVPISTWSDDKSLAIRPSRSSDIHTGDGSRND